ncbi:hypothetical protein TNCV_1423211 [Trichonephila clavipes]|nr:hypothetical protein TNCV_1423211 [Trichonephila clavipes]
MTLPQDVDLRAHLRLHTNVKPFVCEICKLTFSCDSDLKTHLPMKSSKLAEFATRHSLEFIILEDICLFIPRKRLTSVKYAVKLSPEEIL